MRRSARVTDSEVRGAPLSSLSMTIRRVPEDFMVEERLSASFRSALRASTTGVAAITSGPPLSRLPSASTPPGGEAGGRRERGSFAVYALTKTSMTTPETIQWFARALGRNPGVIGYGGLKDKHARTTQHITVPVHSTQRGSSAAESIAMPPEVSGKGWSARLIGYSQAEIAAEAIECNRFTIVVRDLARETCREMDRRATLLETGDHERGHGPKPGLLVVNYFGDQRFGSARHGAGFVARRLIEGDFEGALRLAIGTPARKDSGKTRQFTRMAASHWGDWSRLAAELPRIPERRAIEVLASGGSAREAFAALPYFLQSMYVEAYQSHLWNAAARTLTEALGATRGVLRSDDTFGEMVFPIAEGVGAREREIEMPLPARGTRLQEPWGEAMARALRDEGVEVSQLRVPGLRRPFFGEAMRRLFVRAAEFEMSDPEADELSAGSRRLRRTIAFELPRGAYATVVLRALGQ